MTICVADYTRSHPPRRMGVMLSRDPFAIAVRLGGRMALKERGETRRGGEPARRRATSPPLSGVGSIGEEF